MIRQVLDANRLIQHWQRTRPRTIAGARASAVELIELYGTGAIVTPVAIEFLGGTRDKGELALARAFISQFHAVDEGRILPEDFVQARALAERIPPVFRPRGFADCLIRAIADRLHYDVNTADAGMPRALSRSATGRTKRGHSARRRKGR